MLAINTIQIILLVLTGLATLYILLFSIAGLFYRERTFAPSGKYRKIAVFVPGYKEDGVIVEVAKEALAQNYPAEWYDVIIIADSFQPETIQQLRQLPLKVIEVVFEKSTKSKALNSAMGQLAEPYEIAVILDADNVMASDFLVKINGIFDQHCMAVQGHRTAKNMNTPLAILDAVSEEINNHIFRKGHVVLGFSSAIIGSGMAFQYDYFKQLMSTVTAIGGFDKEIELKMLRAGYKILYLNNALVYDEKVQKAEVFSNQRRRWLSAQLHYFRTDFLSSLKDLLLKGNFDYFDKAIQFIQPPRILLLGGLLVLGAIFTVINVMMDNGATYTYIWSAITGGCILAFLLAIPGSFYNFQTAKAVLSLPKGMLLMFGSLLKIKGANKKFLHTQHTSTTLNS
jgi:cellulose synthase/poly-beta-1,6-N-acetylglucosamine synthase-like glycosyltransferase